MQGWHIAPCAQFWLCLIVRTRSRISISNAPGVQKLALQSMVGEIRSATASMTSVPKPLKFLNVHLDALGARCDQLPPGENRSMLADIVSVLATTVAPKEGERTALKFRLLGEIPMHTC